MCVYPSEELNATDDKTDTEKADMRIVQASAQEVVYVCMHVCMCASHVWNMYTCIQSKYRLFDMYVHVCLLQAYYMYVFAFLLYRF